MQKHLLYNLVLLSIQSKYLKYLNQKNYLSALNRFSVVVKDYQTTPQIEEALYRQVEVYTILGLNQEAEISRKILGHNYPDSKWYKLAQKLKD